MNRYAQDMMMRRRMMRDGRNPYGSKGGYVTSSRRGRDRMDSRDYGMDMMDSRRGRRDYGMMDSRDYGMDSRRGRDSRDYRDNAMDSRDYRDNAMDSRDYRDNAMDGRRGRDYADYNMDSGYGYGDRRSDMYDSQSYDSRDSRDMGYGYGIGMFDYDTEDYGMDGHNKLSTKDIKKWEKSMENADGTRGKHFDMEQIEQVAKQMNIKFDEYRPETLCAVVNMMYSDYCKVLGNDMMIYVKLAKAFLEDDDFSGSPEEKAMLYYKCIVEKD